MKKYLFLAMILLASISYSFAQSFEITPQTVRSKSTISDQIILQSTNLPEIIGIRHGGSLTSPAATPTGGNLVRLLGRGHTGSAFTNDKAGISLVAANAWTPTSTGSNIQFTTTAIGTTNMVERMRITDTGYVGLGTDSPDFPLHLASTSGSTSSTTGAFSIGSTSGVHTIFNQNQINTWNNTSGATLFLNFYSNAKVQIGSGANGNLDVNGFSNLGDGAPAIKMKKLTGTTSSTSTGTTTIAHGLDGTKILSIDVLVEYSTGDYIPPGYDLGGGSNFKFTYYLGGSSIYIINQSSPSILSKPIKIIVTYEQ